MMIMPDRMDSCNDDCSDYMSSSNMLSLVQTYLKALFKNSENTQEIVDTVSPYLEEKHFHKILAEIRLEKGENVEVGKLFTPQELETMRSRK